jgi:O-antigen/teichoic acid export membrane protein
MTARPARPAGAQPRSRLGVSALWVASGKLLTLASMLGISVLVARFGGAGELGVFSAGLSLALLLDVVLGSPLDQATLRFGLLYRDQDGRGERMMLLAFRLKLAVGLLLAAGIALASGPLALWLLPQDPRPAVLVVAGLAAAALLLGRGVAAYFQIDSRFKAYSLLDISQSLLRLGGAAAAALLGVRLAEPYLGLIGAAALAAAVLALSHVPRQYLRAGWPSRSDASSIGSYVMVATLVVVAGNLTARSDVLLLSGSGRPVSAVGIYAAAAQLSALATLPAVYAGLLMQPRVIPAARAGTLNRLLVWNVLAGAAFAAAVLPLAAALAPWLLPAMFGDQFSPASGILLVLLAGACCDVLTFPVTLNFAIQLFPRPLLAGELAITAAFFALAPVALGGGLIGMAILASGARAAKVVLYYGVALCWGRGRRLAAALGQEAQPAGGSDDHTRAALR